MTLELVEAAPALTGAILPRLHTPWVEGNSRVDAIIELSERIGQPLLEWQSVILRDMCAVDENDMFVKKSSLLVCSRQSGKSHVLRSSAYAGTSWAVLFWRDEYPYYEFADAYGI